jgi:hypothetical protein
MLQLYRLHVLHTENSKAKSSTKRKTVKSRSRKGGKREIYIISDGKASRKRSGKRFANEFPCVVSMSVFMRFHIIDTNILHWSK